MTWRAGNGLVGVFEEVAVWGIAIAYALPSFISVCVGRYVFQVYMPLDYERLLKVWHHRGKYTPNVLEVGPFRILQRKQR